MLRRYEGPYVVAFSGGPDSMALLALLRHHLASAEQTENEAASPRALIAAHLDHGLDADSARRAACCRRLAGDLGVPLLVQRASPPKRFADGLEAWAREERYAFLESARRAGGARWILTAHHARDHLETVLLRILSGSRIWGLSGVAPRHGRVLRPLLEVDPDALHRRAQQIYPHRPVHDPTNNDLARPRNLVRRRLMPRLAAGTASYEHRVAEISRRAERVRKQQLPRVATAVDLRPERTPHAASILLPPQATTEPPPYPTLQLVLQALHESVAAPPPRTSALYELARQLRTDSGQSRATRGSRGTSGRRVAVDIGEGWSWQMLGSSRPRLYLSKHDPAVDARRSDYAALSTSTAFAYTLPIPGTLWIPEIARSVRVALRGFTEDEAVETSATHLASQGLAVVCSRSCSDAVDNSTEILVPIASPAPPREIEIRTRRPGDRVPSHSTITSTKKLKERLSRSGIPKELRDRLPLLLVDGLVLAWFRPPDFVGELAKSRSSGARE